MFKLIQTDQDPGNSGANQEDAGDSTFIQIGEPAAAVVMRLRAKLPRIKVTRLTPREEDQSQPL